MSKADDKTEAATQADERRDKLMAELRGLWPSWVPTAQELAEWARFFDEMKLPMQDGLNRIRAVRRDKPFHTPAIAHFYEMAARQGSEGGSWAPELPEPTEWVVCVTADPRYPHRLGQAEGVRLPQGPLTPAQIDEYKKGFIRQMENYRGGTWQIVQARSQWDARAMVDPEYKTWYEAEKERMRRTPEKDRPALVLEALRGCGKLQSRRTGPPERTK